jgi:hypothetical protein
MAVDAERKDIEGICGKVSSDNNYLMLQLPVLLGVPHINDINDQCLESLLYHRAVTSMRAPPDWASLHNKLLPTSI